VSRKAGLSAFASPIRVGSVRSARGSGRDAVDDGMARACTLIAS
jgi:hypothetical protein